MMEAKCSLLVSSFFRTAELNSFQPRYRMLVALRSTQMERGKSENRLKYYDILLFILKQIINRMGFDVFGLTKKKKPKPVAA